MLLEMQKNFVEIKLVEILALNLCHPSIGEELFNAHISFAILYLI